MFNPLKAIAGGAAKVARATPKPFSMLPLGPVTGAVAGMASAPGLLKKPGGLPPGQTRAPGLLGALRARMPQQPAAMPLPVQAPAQVPGFAPMVPGQMPSIFGAAAQRLRGR